MNNNQQPMKRCLLHIQVDAATRTFNAQRPGNWADLLVLVDVQFQELFPIGKYVRRDIQQGIITFQLPPQYQYGSQLPDSLNAWLKRLATTRGLEYRFEEVELQVIAEIKTRKRNPEQEQCIQTFVEEHGRAIREWPLSEHIIRVVALHGDDYIVLHNLLQQDLIVSYETYLSIV